MATVTRIGFTSGVHSSWDPSSVPPTAIWRGRNIRISESGLVRIRPPYQLVNGTPFSDFGLRGLASAFGAIFAVNSSNLTRINTSDGSWATLSNSIPGSADVQFLRWSHAGVEKLYIFTGQGIYESDGSTVSLVTPYTPVQGEPTNLIRALDGSQDTNSGPARCTIALVRPTTGQRVAATGNPNSPNTVYFSHPSRADYWPSDQVIQLPDDGGEIAALALWAGVLLIFRNAQRDIWGFVGTDATDTESRLVLMDSSIGCAIPGSVATIPSFGVVFAGTHGVFALRDLAGVENAVRSTEISSEIHNEYCTAIGNSSTNSAGYGIFYRGEYYLTIPEAPTPECVFTYKPGVGWFADTWPRATHGVIHDGNLYWGCKGHLYKYGGNTLTDCGAEIPVSVTFAKETLAIGYDDSDGPSYRSPAKVKKVYIIMPKKGRSVLGVELHWFYSEFNNTLFGSSVTETVDIVEGTEQNVKATVFVDGVDYKFYSTAVKTARSPTVSAEPVVIHELRFSPSPKGHFFQLRVDSTSVGEDIAIVGYGVEFEPRQDFKGTPKEVAT